MNEIIKSELFSLLSDASPVTNEEIENAYGGFMAHIKAIGQSENNYSEVFRMLNITRVELTLLQSFYRHEEEKKCPEINLSTKSLIPCRCRIKAVRS